MAFLSSPNLLPLHISRSLSALRFSSFTATKTTTPTITPTSRLRRLPIIPQLSIPSPTTLSHRYQPITISHPNPAENSTKSHTLISSACQNILYSPLLFALLAHPLSALSQDTATNPTTATPPVKTFPENDALTNFLGATVLLLLVYASIGVVTLTIRNFFANRNDERHLAVLDQLIRENPGSKTFFDSYDNIEQVKALINQKPASSKSKPLPRPGGNRQYRRTEKKIRTKELRAEKRKQKLADKASAPNSQNPTSKSSKSS